MYKNCCFERVLTMTEIKLLRITLVLSLVTACAAGAQEKEDSMKSLHTSSHVIQDKQSVIIKTFSLLFEDNFNGINDTIGLKARGYNVYFRGTGMQGMTAVWFQGNADVFSAYGEPDTGYVAANYNSVTSNNTIDNWLVLPALVYINR